MLTLATCTSGGSHLIKTNFCVGVTLLKDRDKNKREGEYEMGRKKGGGGRRSDRTG